MKWVVGAVGLFVVLMGPMVGLFSQPLAPWWFGQHTTAAAASVPIQIGDLPVGDTPHVSDGQRYGLAVAAGFSSVEAITATAISIAEDGPGNPLALSGANRDGSRDFCLLQINSGWWSRFGGQAALADPLTCFKAGYAIKQIQGWCAWSTYGPCPTHPCGPPCYLDFMGRANTAANGAKHQ